MGEKRQFKDLSPNGRDEFENLFTAVFKCRLMPTQTSNFLYLNYIGGENYYSNASKMKSINFSGH